MREDRKYAEDVPPDLKDRAVRMVEFTAMNRVHWWNTTRLHQHLDHRTPGEVEAAYEESPDSHTAVVPT